jgi:hypothetical protein
MPPRHAFWTIILEGKPTAFRAHTREELLPTLRQLQARHPDAVLMWFARGRLWESPEQQREAAARRRAGDERRRTGWRPGGEHRDPRERFKIPRAEKRRRFGAKWKQEQNEKRPDRPFARREEHSQQRPTDQRAPGHRIEGRPRTVREPQGRPDSSTGSGSPRATSKGELRRTATGSGRSRKSSAAGREPSEKPLHRRSGGAGNAPGRSPDREQRPKWNRPRGAGNANRRREGGWRKPGGGGRRGGGGGQPR